MVDAHVTKDAKTEFCYFGPSVTKQFFDLLIIQHLGEVCNRFLLKQRFNSIVAKSQIDESF